MGEAGLWPGLNLARSGSYFWAMEFSKIPTRKIAIFRLVFFEENGIRVSVRNS